MALTRARLNDIQSRGLVFCDFWVVGYFLQLSWNQVDHLYESGRLPKALCPDGSEYRPSGERLVVADAFVEMIPEERRRDFALWRHGAFTVDSFASRDSAAPAFGVHRVRIGQSDRPDDR